MYCKKKSFLSPENSLNMFLSLLSIGMKEKGFRHTEYFHSISSLHILNHPALTLMGNLWWALGFSHSFQKFMVIYRLFAILIFVFPIDMSGGKFFCCVVQGMKFNDNLKSLPNTETPKNDKKKSDRAKSNFLPLSQPLRIMNHLINYV